MLALEQTSETFECSMRRIRTDKQKLYRLKLLKATFCKRMGFLQHLSIPPARETKATKKIRQVRQRDNQAQSECSDDDEDMVELPPTGPSFKDKPSARHPQDLPPPVDADFVIEGE